MPIVNGPFRDPEEVNPPRRRKPPKDLARLNKQFTYEQRLDVFRQVFHREPSSDDELESFAEGYIRELYNSGMEP